MLSKRCQTHLIYVEEGKALNDLLPIGTVRYGETDGFFTCVDEVCGNGSVQRQRDRRNKARRQGSMLWAERYPEELDSGNSGRGPRNDTVNRRVMTVIPG